VAFIPLASLQQLRDGFRAQVRVDRMSLLLLQHDGKVYIIENRCPHMDASLNDAPVDAQGRIRCRSHGIAFDLNSGRADGPLAGVLDCLKRFVPVYEGNKVGVEV